MTHSYLPIMLTDMAGAVTMIVLAFICVHYVAQLKRRDPQNIVWAYLFWVCLSLAVFAVSRSVGHLLQQLLVLAGHRAWWERLRPYSGAINSLTFMLVGSMTLFFERTWTVYQDVIEGRRALQVAHGRLVYLNQNLEQLVEERTNALSLSEQKYRRIFEASKDMILSVRPDGAILDINAAGIELLGLTDDFSSGSRFLTACLNDPSIWPQVVETIERQGFVSSLEIDLKIGGGQRRRVLLSGSKTLAADETRTFYFVFKDVEQQYRMREQMAQADKLASIGEFSAGIAHEINNPLGVILGYTQLILRGSAQGSQQYDDLKTIEKHVRHCKSIVEDLLSLARTSTPLKAACDLHPLIDEVLAFIQKHTKPGRIDIRKSYDPRLGPLMMEEKKIKQVLINLIMNARYAVGEQGVITVRTTCDEASAQAVIRIEDTGGGIAPEHLARIFDPFFTTKPTGEGTGLGLSVSYGIVKKHGGEITVQSRPGEGAAFTVTLPLPNAAGR